MSMSRFYIKVSLNKKWTKINTHCFLIIINNDNIKYILIFVHRSLCMTNFEHFIIKIAEFAYFLFKYRMKRGEAATSRAEPLIAQSITNWVETCNWPVRDAVSLHVANIMFADMCKNKTAVKRRWVRQIVL